MDYIAYCILSISCFHLYACHPCAFHNHNKGRLSWAQVRSRRIEHSVPGRKIVEEQKNWERQTGREGKMESRGHVIGCSQAGGQEIVSSETVLIQNTPPARNCLGAGISSQGARIAHKHTHTYTLIGSHKLPSSPQYPQPPQGRDTLIRG